MAYAAVVSLAQTIDLILNHPKYSIPPQEKDQIIRVKEYASLLQDFLEDFPEKAKSYEARIRELIQGAEDILEFSLSEHIQHSSVGSSKSTSYQQMGQPYECGRYKSYSQLKQVELEIELIVEKVMKIKNSITNKDERAGDSTDHVACSPSTSAPVQEEAMVGLENNLMEVKLRLCSDSSNLQILPIVGMRGIGKTTLARNVYDDPLITDRFDIRAWVTVSQDYSIQDIVSGLLVSMGDAKIQLMKQHNVFQKLKGRRYLVVIDDIWSIEAWDEIKLMFPDDGNGSRIMLTTRLTDLATYAGSCHEMRLMDDDESWDLLGKKVFKQIPCPIDLESIGKTIARSCSGLPLAVVVISGLLAVDQTKAAWEKIAEDVKSAIFANEEQIDKILSLSYTHLPHHLRPCFLYMAGFPEDYEMQVSILIKLWVAEGFLRPERSKSFEETAEEHLEELVRRNLLLVTKRNLNGRIKVVGIHDLVREMCIRKAKEDDFILYVRGLLQRGTRIPHRLTTDILNYLLSVDSSTTRTIICLSNRIGHTRCVLEKLKLLRVLVVSHDWGYFSEKDQVLELFHLRYLALNSPLNIPASISNFQNLQTLIIGPRSNRHVIFNKFSAHDLPVEIWMMPQLRHILCYYAFLPLEEEAEHPLENLQTLSGVVNFLCKTLKLIPNLKKLGLVYHYCQGLDTQWEVDYELENIKYLQQLEILKIVNCSSDSPKLFPTFPKTLKKLSLGNLKLSWEDMSSVVASLPCLEVLKLRINACVGDIWETNEGGFHQLKFLMISWTNLQEWITESSHFPRLKCLVLRRCWALREIPESIGEISTLELIEVDDRNNFLVRSAKQIQVDQQSYGNDALQVRVRRCRDE